MKNIQNGTVHSALCTVRTPKLRVPAAEFQFPYLIFHTANREFIYTETQMTK